MENTEYRINLTVKDLKECLKDLPDDMEVIIVEHAPLEINRILNLDVVRTVGVLSYDGCDLKALCLACTEDGADMYSLLTASNHFEGIKCETLLF